MATVAGVDCVVKISGTKVELVGEATTQGGGNTTYQITDTAKQVLDRTETIYVCVKGSDDTAESGTTTTNLKMTGHGLQTGDCIINTSRSSAKRKVTYVDVDNVTVSAVTGQTTGDTIQVYKQAASTAYTLNRLNGTATFTSALDRTVLIDGYYLPMSSAAYAFKMSHAMACDILESTRFGSAYKQRLAGLKYASGTLGQFDMTDTTYVDALQAGDPIVIEDRSKSDQEPNRFWALLDSDQVEAAVDGLQSETVSWVSYDAWIKLGV